MANILTHPTNGAIYFDDGTAGSSSVPALTGDAVSLNYDGSAGLNITSYNTTSTDRFSIDGDSGRLFSVNDSLTGTIFSVNDAAGLPIIEVESTSTTDTITMGTYASNALVVAGDRVGIGTASPGSSYKLDVTGDVNINGDIVLGGKLDFSGNITAATSDTDVFVVIDAGELKTRTGAQVLSDIGALSSETVTSLALTSGSLVYTNESGTANSISLAAYLDEDSRSIASGSLNSTSGIVTFTRDDSTTFTLDLGPLLDDTNLVTSVAGKSGVVTLVKGDVGLSNVTNESKATMFSSPSFTGDVDVAGSITTEGPDGGMVMRTWTGGGSYGMIGTANMSGGEYSLLTDGTSTYLSGGTGGNVYIRGGNNDSSPQITVSGGNIGLAGVPSKASEATAIVWDGTNIGYRELGSAAFSATSAFAPATGSTSIVSLGTVVTGDWNAGVISSTYLDADTAHLSGTQTFSGAKTFSSGLNISVSTSNTQLKLKRTGTATGEFNIYTNNDTLFFNNVGQSSFPMVIDEDGNVGIGTTSPASKLHVDDNAATGAGLLVTGGGSGASLATFRRDVGNTGSEVSISAASGDAQMLFTNSTHFYSIGIDASENKFKISDNNYIGTNDRFTIDGSGNVGIGTTSPSAALDVVGSSKFRGTVNHSWFNYSTGEDTYIRGGKTTSKVHINDSHSADVLIAVGGGNVGIGTTSPATILDLDDGTLSDIRIRGNATTDVRFAGIAFYNTAGSDTVAAVNVDRDGANDAGALTFDTQPAGGGNTERMRITSSGKVLVNGADDNSGKADFAVSGGTVIAFRNSQVQMGGTDMNWNSKIFDDGQAKWAAWDRNIEIFSTGSNTGSATARDIIFSPQTSGTAASTERMRIKGSGNVGIGTTSPSHKLEIGLTSTVALANQPAEPLHVSNNGQSVDGRVFISVKHDVVNTASAVGAGFKMTAAAVTSGTASYDDSLIFLESAGPGNDTIHSAPKAIKFYVDNHATNAGSGANYADLGDLALTIGEDTNATFGGTVSATNFRPTNIVTNKVVKFNGTQLDDANITDTGSLITLGSNVNINSVFDFNTSTDLLTITNNQNTGGIKLSGGNSRIYFGNYRAIEGDQSGGTLYIGEGYGAISLMDDVTVSGDLTVSGEVEFSALNSASASPFVVSDGGTLGTRTAAEVLDDIGGRVTKKISGDGSATTFTVTHSFGTPHVMTQLLHYGNNGTGATYEVVQATVKRNSDNAIDVVFGTAPTSSEDYLVLITKMPAIS